MHNKKLILSAGLYGLLMLPNTYANDANTLEVDPDKVLKSYVTDNNISLTEDEKLEDLMTSPNLEAAGASNLPDSQDATYEGGNTTDISEVLVEKPDNSNESMLEIAPSEGSSEIALLLNDDINPIQWHDKANRLHHFHEVRHLYATLNYRPLWTEGAVITPLGKKMIAQIFHAWQHALPSKAYHANVLRNIDLSAEQVEPEKLDVILTDAFITLKMHLANGIVEPKKQFSTWNQPAKKLDFNALYQQAVLDNGFEKVLTVANPDYATLKQAYIATRTAAESNLPPISTKATLAPGSKGAQVALLREYLSLDPVPDVYDADVVAAVKALQRGNGLKADGIAGRNTLKLLNGDSRNSEILAINMERMRWSNVPKNRPYVTVNIPAYKMNIRDDNDYLFESNVIVGRPDRQTPIFSDVMEHVVLAPYWNVPQTIYQKDKLPRLQRNPYALGQSMQVIQASTGKPVDPGSVNWANGGQGYRLRQLPGANNALGRMKFLFPNQHAIYLHDTPNRKLFSRSRRDFSSGCVRVERAEDLAVFLLEDLGYNRSRIKTESQKPKERWVNLKDSHRYPIFLNYYTAWVDSNGKLRYSADIYNYDGKMKKLYRDALGRL